MRVLIFSLSYFPLVGGAEIAVKEITDRIPLSEIEFDLVTLRFERSAPARERVGNVNVYRLACGPGYLGKILFVFRAALFANVRQYDLYWAIMTNMLFPISLLKLSGKRTPYILTLQDGDPFEYVFERWYIRPFRPLLSFGFRHASRVQAISTYLAGWARHMGFPGTVMVVPNGVNSKKFANLAPHHLDDARVTLITTSRLVEKNGVGDIIAALPLLPGSVTLAILGTGPLEASLKGETRELQVEKRVRFLGFVPQEAIPKHLHDADIFVRPSLSEGMGNSFIEAMAAGLPIVATSVGGITDFLKDGETGLACEPRNPASVARAIKRFLDDPALRERVKANALKLVREKYDWDLIAQEMKERVFAKV